MPYYFYDNKKEKNMVDIVAICNYTKTLKLKVFNINTRDFLINQVTIPKISFYSTVHQIFNKTILKPWIVNINEVKAIKHSSLLGFIIEFTFSNEEYLGIDIVKNNFKTFLKNKNENIKH